MISVIICTHNPRRDYLERALAALKAQTLPMDKWELLIVDNNSDTLLTAERLVNWHPGGRVVREDEPGLIAARFRGMAETTGDLLVFVDDDNVLDESYLEVAMCIASRIPSLGAFGSGCIEGEFEGGIEPSFSSRARGQLTIGGRPDALWSNQKSSAISPSGAGMVIRRNVARSYEERCREGGWTLVNVFRVLGISLKTPGGDDFDLGYEAANSDMAMGRFPSLKLTHLMPRKRLERDYLKRLIRNNARSMALLSYVHNDDRLPRHRMPRREWLNGLMAWIGGNWQDFELEHQWRLGEVDAYKLVQEHRAELEELRRKSLEPTP